MRRSMLPIWPDLVCADTLTADGALAVISFGVPLTSASANIPIRQLGPSPLAEVWRSMEPVTRGRYGSISFARNANVLAGTTSADGSETDATTEQLYQQIVEAARQAGYPHLIRVWNHVGGINECEGDLERYQRFSAGRHEALIRLGYERTQFPAACAVGMNRSGLVVYFLASRTPGVQVENPRQVAAYEYPPEYGPRSPSFARATVVQWNGEAMVFVAGTSSVVGHKTLHAGDVIAQLDETLRNLDLIVRESAARAGYRASLDDLSFIKTYLRNAADYDVVADRVTAALPRARHLFLESDICRRDLLIEIEGVARL